MMLRSRLTQLFPVLMGIVLFAISIWVITQELREHSVQKILESLAAIPAGYVWLAIGLTVLNYVAFTGYDTLAVRYIHRSLSYRKTALVAVISYAISNSIGFALLSGSAIRYRFYNRWGLSAIEITQIITFTHLSFFLGLFAVGGVMFVLEPIAVPSLLHLPFESVHPIGLLFLSIITFYLLWSGLSHQSLRVGHWNIPHLPLHLSLIQLVVTTADWALAAAILYVLLPNIPLSYPGFFGIYLLAQLAGIISNIPGGLGVFETVMLLLLSPPVSSAVLFGALLAYRAVYYFLPLLVALVLLSISEIRLRMN